ncbi:cell division protein FtsQ/DivIB [Methylosinus sporium]|uniref:Cell division protein FtsQ n=1 Tax=Methylosinus sporium TaxID=428 RepID=A0A2U1SPP2_METSR|nr:cell division protein FtsQ/DivIB [Methylosinus sporium]PWB93584.1 cell division protein FtsQ [Methylosinus sporium]
MREPVEALFDVAHPHPVQAGSLHAGSLHAGAYSAPYVNPVGSEPAERRGRSAASAAQAERGRLSRIAALPGIGTAALALLFGAVGSAGVAHNGGYAEFVARNGAPRDIVARALGFSIEVVTISGLGELSESDVLAASGVKPTNSLLFLDAETIRERLTALPLVESARVLKLYPDRLIIALEGRRPFALWQRDGKLSVVAADGVVIDEMRDERFIGLPFVVGEGAEKRLDEYMRLLEAAGDLKSRVRAGVLVSGRRWSLDMTNGVEVKLPEREPEAALALLQRLQREARILDKDVISIDLRASGRVAVRLSEEAVAARAAATSRNSRKGGQT